MFYNLDILITLYIVCCLFEPEISSKNESMMHFLELGICKHDSFYAFYLVPDKHKPNVSPLVPSMAL